MLRTPADPARTKDNPVAAVVPAPLMTPSKFCPPVFTTNKPLFVEEVMVPPPIPVFTPAPWLLSVPTY